LLQVILDDNEMDNQRTQTVAGQVATCNLPTQVPAYASQGKRALEYSSMIIELWDLSSTYNSDFGIGYFVHTSIDQ
jgi:hypothetical protein